MRCSPNTKTQNHDRHRCFAKYCNRLKVYKDTLITALCAMKANLKRAWSHIFSSSYPEQYTDLTIRRKNNGKKRRNKAERRKNASNGIHQWLTKCDTQIMTFLFC